MTDDYTHGMKQCDIDLAKMKILVNQYVEHYDIDGNYELMINIQL